MGACVLGEELTFVTELDWFKLEQWTLCVFQGQTSLQEAFLLNVGDICGVLQ